MKTTNVIKRVFSFALALLMVFSMMPQITLGASAVTMTGGEKLYLTPNSNWKVDNARYAIYVFNGSSNAWASMTKVAGETDLYEVTVPNGSWNNVIFCRMNPSASANNWDNKWNQTADLVYDGSKNHYTVKAGTWDSGGGTWSVYAPVVETEAPKETETPAQTEAPKETTVPTEAPVVNNVTVYAINSMGWGSICAYVWNVNPYVAWPGAAMTKTGETVNGFDVYSYTFPENCDKIIFNNNNAGSQTNDLAVKAGQYYDVKGGKWYASLSDVPTLDPLASDVYLVGEFNGWSTVQNEFKKTAAGDTVAVATLTLAANTAYKYKIINNGAWTSTTTSITGDVSGVKFSSSVDDNAKITTKDAGEYVFTYDLTANTLSVSYPEAPTEPQPEAPAAPNAANVSGALLNLFCRAVEGHISHQPGFDALYCTVLETGYDSGEESYWADVQVNVKAYAEALAKDNSEFALHTMDELGEEIIVITCKWNGTAWIPSGTQDVSFTCVSDEPAGKQYALVGWINGANYGCGEDSENIGEYIFVDGKLTATFTSDSYVFVKTTDNATWYMTDGWAGEVTSVTLYDTALLDARADKLMVPGGVELTFTLVENADGTLTLSYSDGPAADEPEADTEINTSEELVAAFAAGGQYKLGSDLVLEEAAYVYADTVLDLNGKKITMTIMDSEDYNWGRIIVGNPYMGCPACTLTLRNGTVEHVLDGGIDLYSGTLNLENGNYEPVNIWTSGNALLNITNSTVGNLYVEESQGTARVNKDADSTITEMGVIAGTFNFDPSFGLYAGYTATESDGLWTVSYAGVQETGETYRIYLYNWYKEVWGGVAYDQPYFMTEDGEIATDIVLEFSDFEMELPMTQSTENSRVWYVDVDTAYKKALVQFESESCGLSTYMLKLTAKENQIYLPTEMIWVDYDPSAFEEPETITIYYNDYRADYPENDYHSIMYDKNDSVELELFDNLLQKVYENGKRLNEYVWKFVVDVADLEACTSLDFSTTISGYCTYLANCPEEDGMILSYDVDTGDYIWTRYADDIYPRPESQPITIYFNDYTPEYPDDNYHFCIPSEDNPLVLSFYDEDDSLQKTYENGEQISEYIWKFVVDSADLEKNSYLKFNAEYDTHPVDCPEADGMILSFDVDEECFVWTRYADDVYPRPGGTTEPEGTIIVYFDSGDAGWTDVMAMYGRSMDETPAISEMNFLADGLWYIRIPADSTFIKFAGIVEGERHYTDTLEVKAGRTYYADGTFVDGTDGPVASIGDEMFDTLEAALEAAESGDVIKLLIDDCVIETDIPEGAVLDLNGHKLAITNTPFTGRISFNGGSLVPAAAPTAEMIGPNGMLMKTTDGIIDLLEEGMALVGGTFTMGAAGGAVTVAGTAKLIVPDDAGDEMSFVLNSPDASIVGPADMDVVTELAGYDVVYENGTYTLAATGEAAAIGDETFNTLEAALAAAESGDVIKLLIDGCSNETDIPEGAVLDLNGHKLAITATPFTGRISFNGGSLVLAVDPTIEMYGPNGMIAKTVDGIIDLTERDMTLVSGTYMVGDVSATFILGGTAKLIANSDNAHYVSCVLNSPDASVAGPADMDIATDLEGYEVVYENGTYTLALSDEAVKIYIEYSDEPVIPGLTAVDDDGLYYAVVAEGEDLVLTMPEAKGIFLMEAYNYEDDSSTVTNSRVDGTITMPWEVISDEGIEDLWLSHYPNKVTVNLNGGSLSDDTMVWFYDYGGELAEDGKSATMYYPTSNWIILEYELEWSTFVKEGCTLIGFRLNGGTEIVDRYECVDGLVVDLVWQADYVAKIGDTEYDSLQDALDAAKEGDSIKLFSDAAVDALILVEGVTLDLNGNSVQVSEYTTVYAGNHIVDSVGGGLLKSRYVMIDDENRALPVWDDANGGYALVELDDFKEKTEALSENSAKYTFLPYLDASVYDLLAQGAQTSEVTLKIEVSWTSDDGKPASAIFVYTDALMQQFAQMYPTANRKAFTLSLTGTAGKEISYRVFFESNTGVVYECGVK